MNRNELIDACLAGFIEAGSLSVSLDDLAKRAHTSKRMLIHYFGGRENLEELAMSRLEDRLRAQFQASAFTRSASLHSVVMALWERTTAPASRGVLLLIMDVSRRAWSGSQRAEAFYREQQKLWVDMLLAFQPDPAAVEELLQLFQGATLVYLITGDAEQGRRALSRTICPPKI